MITKADFMFRVWLYDKDSDIPAEFEIFFIGLEPDDAGRTVHQWIRESFSEFDFHESFGLSDDRCWQVLGQATLSGSYSFDGEYDEDIEFEVLQSCEFKPNERL